MGRLCLESMVSGFNNCLTSLVHWCLELATATSCEDSLYCLLPNGWGPASHCSQFLCLDTPVLPGLTDMLQTGWGHSGMTLGGSIMHQLLLWISSQASLIPFVYIESQTKFKDSSWFGSAASRYVFLDIKIQRIFKSYKGKKFQDVFQFLYF